MKNKTNTCAAWLGLFVFLFQIFALNIHLWTEAREAGEQIQCKRQASAVVCLQNSQPPGHQHDESTCPVCQKLLHASQPLSVLVQVFQSATVRISLVPETGPSLILAAPSWYAGPPRAPPFRA